MTVSKKSFTVVGPHRVHGVEPGETLELDASDPGAVRLLSRGQIVPASSRKRPADVTYTEGVPTEDVSEEPEE